MGELSSERIDHKIMKSLTQLWPAAMRANESLFAAAGPERGASNTPAYASPVLLLADSILSELADCLGEGRLAHVLPLRAAPRRIYSLSDVTGEVESPSDLVTRLLSDSDLRERVNHWLTRFGLQIDVAEIMGTIYRLTVRAANSDLALDLVDVGFGISQALPVVVACLSSQPGSLTIVEQPEIHLHPNLQADLADLFIESAISAGTRPQPRFLVETHSQPLLHRLMRRVMERTIDPDKVAVYFLQPDPVANGTSIERVSFDRTGHFAWPPSFYAAELADTVAILQQWSK